MLKVERNVADGLYAKPLKIKYLGTFADLSRPRKAHFHVTAWRTGITGRPQWYALKWAFFVPESDRPFNSANSGVYMIGHNGCRAVQATALQMKPPRIRGVAGSLEHSRSGRDTETDAVSKQKYKKAVKPKKREEKEMYKMKKKMIMLLAGAMMTLTAGNAMAYFGGSTVASTDLILTRVVYDRAGTVEVATDLVYNPATMSLSSDINKVVGGGAAAFSLSQFGAAASWDNLYVAYFAKQSATGNKGWLSGGETALTIGARQNSAFNGNNSSVLGYYNNIGAANQTNIGVAGATKSYYDIMNKGGASIGTFGAFINQQGAGEMSLAALANGNSVTQNIYYFANTAAASTGVKVATMSTNADGSSTINAAQTPIPAAAYLLGSGLLGLLGLRRRGNKA